MKSINQIILLLALVLPLKLVAQVDVPELHSRVTDLTGTLGSSEIQVLEAMLSDLEAKKGSQVAVLILPSTKPEEIEQYSIRVVEKWKLGRKKVDDGAILVVAKDDHRMRIEVGYGLEGALNDATCKKIIAEIITPLFKEGNYSEGIREGIQAMTAVIMGEELPAPTHKGRSLSGNAIFIMVFIGIVIGEFLKQILGRFAGPPLAALASGLIALLLASLPIAILCGFVVLVMSFLSGTRVGGFGSSWSSGGSGFSGGGGSFSGGGGSFGGGGASGSW